MKQLNSVTRKFTNNERTANENSSRTKFEIEIEIGKGSTGVGGCGGGGGKGGGEGRNDETGLRRSIREKQRELFVPKAAAARGNYTATGAGNIRN